MREVYTDLYQLLASYVTSIHLDRDKSGKLRTQMGTCSFADPWRPSDHHRSVYICAILPRLLEAGLEAARPIFQPLLESLDLTLVATYLLEGFWCISNGPQLGQRIDGLATADKH